MFFIGDVLYEFEKEYVKKYNLYVIILKVGYYGSSIVIFEEFLENVKLKVVVILVGKDNIFGYFLNEVL